PICRGVNDGAEAVVEDRVILVLAFLGETDFAALLATRKLFIAEIPAARALQDGSAERRHVAYLRRGRMTGGFGQRGRVLPNRRMLRQRRQSHQGTDADGPFVL